MLEMGCTYSAHWYCVAPPGTCRRSLMYATVVALMGENCGSRPSASSRSPLPSAAISHTWPSRSNAIVEPSADQEGFAPVAVSTRDPEPSARTRRSEAPEETATREPSGDQAGPIVSVGDTPEARARSSVPSGSAE